MNFEYLMKDAESDKATPLTGTTVDFIPDFLAGFIGCFGTLPLFGAEVSPLRRVSSSLRMSSDVMATSDTLFAVDLTI